MAKSKLNTTNVRMNYTETCRKKKSFSSRYLALETKNLQFTAISWDPLNGTSQEKSYDSPLTDGFSSFFPTLIVLEECSMLTEDI